MKIVWLLVTFRFLFIQFHSTHAQKVVDLTGESFSSYIASESLVLVDFFAPWCGHCESLSPILDKVAFKLHDLQIHAKIAKIDSTLSSGEIIAQEEQIDGFPSLMLYKQGKNIGEYFGNRSENDILEYIRGKIGSPAKEITSQLELVPYIASLEAADNIEKNFLAIVIGFFISSDTQTLNRRIFYEAAEQFELAKYFESSYAPLLSEFNIQQDSVIVFTADEQDIYHLILLEGAINSQSLIHEFSLLSLPLSIPYSSSTQSLLSQIPVKTHLLVFYGAEDDAFLDILITIAGWYRSQVQLVEVSSDEYHLLHYFNIATADLPQLLLTDISNTKDPRKFSFAEYLYARAMEEHQRDSQERKLSIKVPIEGEEIVLPFGEKEVEEFIQSYFAGELPRTLASQKKVELDVLNSQLAHLPIKNIAGNQFHDMVIAPEEMDVFVFFQAPWCIHCKAIEAVLTDVALHFQSKGNIDGNIRFYRMDISKNEISYPGVSILAVPAMYLFPAYNRQEPIEFDGERVSQQIIRFIKQMRYYKESTEGEADRSRPAEVEIEVQGNSFSSSGDQSNDDDDDNDIVRGKDSSTNKLKDKLDQLASTRYKNQRNPRRAP